MFKRVVKHLTLPSDQTDLIQINDQKFERRDIKTGISDGINVEIISGITIEDNIKIWNQTEEEKKEDEDEPSKNN